MLQVALSTGYQIASTLCVAAKFGAIHLVAYNINSLGLIVIGGALFLVCNPDVRNQLPAKVLVGVGLSIPVAVAAIYAVGAYMGLTALAAYTALGIAVIAFLYLKPMTSSLDLSRLRDVVGLNQQ